MAKIEESPQKSVIRNAFTLSSLRFKLNPFPNKDSRPKNKILGIPTVLRKLHREKEANKAAAKGSSPKQEAWLTLSSLSELEEALKSAQQGMKSLFSRELAPLMNANPLDPNLHIGELSQKMVHDLEQYVAMQNNPYLFFDLMQWLEKDVAIRRWRAFRAEKPLSAEEATIYVMTGWRDSDGQRRKPITCPIGVPIGYMQAVRRKNQPFITQEFADHAHGALNHWLQEHVWQRFYARYPEKCKLTPSQFFKQLGYSHAAFADSIYELHMSNVANPANTNFWSVLQFYLPLMSPWS